MKSINPWWKVRLFWLAMGLVALILFLLAGCNPVKQAAKAIQKSEKQRAELAALCADQFPVVPKISYLPGAVDTSAVIQWLQSNTNVWGNNTPTTDTIHLKDTVLTKIVNRDTIIQVLKRFIKPDTIRIVGGDSAKVVALEYQLKQVKASIEPTKKENSDLKLKLAEMTGKARTRLWMLIGLLTLLVGVGGTYVYLKLKP